MNEPQRDGDTIRTGDITNVQGAAIGRGASVSMSGQFALGGSGIDAAALRTALEELYDALAEAGLPRDRARSAQTAAGNALQAAQEEEPKPETVVENVKTVGDTLKEAKVAVQEGTALWESVARLAPLLGPLVGGARVVAGWFGIPL